MTQALNPNKPNQPIIDTLNYKSVNLFIVRTFSFKKRFKCEIIWMTVNLFH